MNFQNAERKIRELNQQYILLDESKTVDEFEGHFSAFISAGRSVTMALQNDVGITFDEDGKIKSVCKIPGFAEWYTKKQEEMRNDELCRFFKNIRDTDLHTGKTEIESSVQIKGPITLKAGKNSIIYINNRGVYEVQNLDTPDEIKIPKLIPEMISNICFKNPPQKHKDIDISKKSPLNLCFIFKKYMEELVLEAKKLFFYK